MVVHVVSVLVEPQQVAPATGEGERGLGAEAGEEEAAAEEADLRGIRYDVISVKARNVAPGDRQRPEIGAPGDVVGGEDTLTVQDGVATSQDARAVTGYWFVCVTMEAKLLAELRISCIGGGEEVPGNGPGLVS